MPVALGWCLCVHAVYGLWSLCYYMLDQAACDSHMVIWHQSKRQEYFALVMRGLGNWSVSQTKKNSKQTDHFGQS